MTTIATGGHPDLKKANPAAAAIDIGSTMHMAAVKPDACDTLSGLLGHSPKICMILLTFRAIFIELERCSGFEFCPIGRVGQWVVARRFADCAASGSVAG